MLLSLLVLSHIAREVVSSAPLQDVDPFSMMIHCSLVQVIQPKSHSGSNQPHSGRRSVPVERKRSPPQKRPAEAKRKGGNASDVDLLTSMANRLNSLEKKMDAQRRELAEKTAECVRLRAALNERVDDSQEVRRLMDENVQLRKQRLEMEKFLADYGVVLASSSQRTELG